jgi:hypothetical protein
LEPKAFELGKALSSPAAVSGAGGKSEGSDKSKTKKLSRQAVRDVPSLCGKPPDGRNAGAALRRQTPRQLTRNEKGRISFLKKRNKKLLLIAPSCSFK